MTRQIQSGGLNNIIANVPEDCDVCSALAEEWDRGRNRDALLEIQNHPHGAPKLRRVKDWIGKEGMRVS